MISGSPPPRTPQPNDQNDFYWDLLLGEESTEGQDSYSYFGNDSSDTQYQPSPLDPTDLFPHVYFDFSGDKSNTVHEISVISADDQIPGISPNTDCNEIAQTIQNTSLVSTKRKREKEKEDNNGRKKEKKLDPSNYDDKYLSFRTAYKGEGEGLRLQEISKEEIKEEFKLIDDFFLKIDERYYVLQREFMKIGLANGEKNRFKTNLPYDASRVVNPFCACEYYNATCLPGNIVLAQTPLDNTLCDFWEMAFHADIIVSISESRDDCVPICPIIDMRLNNIIISPVDCYEPICMLPSKKICKLNQFEVSRDGQRIGKKKILQIQMPNWENHHLTEYDLAYFIDYLYSFPASPKILFHCSTGLGNSAILALSLILYRKHRQLQQREEIGSLNLWKFVATYRLNFRFAIINTEDHYEKLFSIIHEFRRVYQTRH